jgi:tetratricopeptide (TPR) repeat protein
MHSTPATTPSNPVKALYDRAVRTLEAGDVEEAEQMCRRALPMHRKDPNIICLMGEISLRQRRPQEAQNLYSTALKRAPGFPRALEGMGLALLADNRPEEAVDFLGRAVAAVPRRSATRTALARALLESGHRSESEEMLKTAFELDPEKAAISRAEDALAHGRKDEAEKTLRDLLAKNPDHAVALRLLARIAVDAGRFRAARKMLERSIELAPNVLVGWTDLASVYMKQDRYDRALEAVQKAIEIDPRMPHSFVVRGNILTRAQRHEESLEAYRQALEVSPANAGALSGMGHVLKTIGRQKESIETYRDCIRKHPAFGEAYWSLANLKTFEFDPQEVEVMEQMVARPDLPDEPKVNFHFSLGKHYENEGQFEQAFDHYRAGNDLRRSREIYDPVQTQVVHDRIINVFSSRFFAEREGWGDPDPSPILIVGLPRSGSTLIEQILSSHSQVEGTMELPDMGRAINELNRRSPPRTEYPEAVLKLDRQQAAALGAGYIESTMRYRSGAPYFIDKMPNNFATVGLLRLILPNARVINARRHPLDSCLGSYKQLFFNGQSFTYDLFELGQYYLQYQRLMDHWHAVLPGRVLDVRYEEMVLDQEAQTRRLLDFLGLPWEDQCLRFYETERAVNTASSEQVRQPIYTRALNFWRNYGPYLGELIEVLEPLLKELPEADRP